MNESIKYWTKHPFQYPRDVPLVTGGMNEIGSSGGSILDHAEQMPEPIAKAITRDYSALMKAIDKRRSK